jgi:tetratricopeptide (TPR) repeat protein
MKKIAAFAIVILLLGGLFVSSGRKDELTEEVNKAYQEGEQAATIASRQENFNKALALLLQLEREYSPLFGTGRLYYATGNTLFQLENYPEAILYYEKARKLMPREKILQDRLATARKKLFLPEKPSAETLRKWLNSFLPLSLPERLQIFFALAFVLFLVFSVSLWSKKTLKPLKYILLFPLVLIGCTLLYTRYFSPVEAIMVHAAMLQKGPGLQYNKTTDAPLPAGSQVEALAPVADGSWFKVLTPNGDFGYVQGRTLRFID